MPQPAQVDLLPLFENVTQSLAANRDALNAADEENGDHGDNMVHNFEVISGALKERQDAPPAEALAYASQQLAKQPNGSAQMYAQNLSAASTQLGDQPLTQENALGIFGSILGAQPGSIAQAQQGAGGQPDLGDLLGGLLGGMAGGQSGPSGGSAGGGVGGDDLINILGGLAGAMGGAQGAAPAGAAPTGGSPAGGTDLGGLLGGLLGGMAGGQGGSGPGASANPPGLDLNDLLAMGAGYLQAKGQGKGDMEAITGAILGGSGMTGRRQQSGQVVLDGLLGGLMGALGGKG